MCRILSESGTYSVRYVEIVTHARKPTIVQYLHRSFGYDWSCMTSERKKNGSTRRKRVWVIVSIALAVTLGGFYYFYFVATNAAIEHAESFLFRRMTVTQLNSQSEFRHFFVTNRNQVTTEGPVEDSFGNERTNRLLFGSFDVTIEPSLGLGMIINPTEWFQNEEIQIDRIVNFERNDAIGTLRDYVDRSPTRSLLIVIHGFRERFDSALVRECRQR